LLGPGFHLFALTALLFILADSFDYWTHGSQRTQLGWVKGKIDIKVSIISENG
jgi:hypothetical protein